MRSVIVAMLIVVLAFLQTGSVWAAERVSLDEQLRILEQGRTPERLIAGAQHRVGVFTFEDADNTGLGDAFAALSGRELLTNSKVNSIGVIFFEGGLSPSADSELSYFDKVELVSEAQDVTLAVWGIIRKTADGVQINTYLQIPASSLGRYFTWRINLPKDMGGGELTARLRPDRVNVRRQVFSAEGLGQVESAAVEIGRVRSDSRTDAQVTANLPMNEIYYLTDRRDGWVRLATQSGIDGWAPTEGHCIGECQSLLESAAFSGEILRYMADGTVPRADGNLSIEAHAVADQLKILDALNSKSRDNVAQAVNDAHAWLGEGAIPPGGAAFENLEALAELASALKEAFGVAAAGIIEGDAGGDGPDQMNDSVRQEIYDSITLTPEFVKSIADHLAQASQYDPRNSDVLGNLAVLFDYLEDPERAELASRLAARYAR